MRPVFLLLAAACALSACATAQELGVMGATAEAELSNAEGRSIGRARFDQGQQNLLIRLETSGLQPGWHGVHLHAQGTCEGPGFQTAGPHVGHVAQGAEQTTHGFLSEKGGEFGDLPNLYVHADGTGRAEFSVAFAFLTGPTQPGDEPNMLLDADGSAIVIHASEDDQRTQPLGGSGARVACGVLRPR